MASKSHRICLKEVCRGLLYNGLNVIYILHTTKFDNSHNTQCNDGHDDSVPIDTLLSAKMHTMLIVMMSPLCSV